MLGYWRSGQVKFVTEGVVLPHPCPVGGGHWRGHSSVEEVSGDLLELCQLLRLWCVGSWFAWGAREMKRDIWLNSVCLGGAPGRL